MATARRPGLRRAGILLLAVLASLSTTLAHAAEPPAIVLAQVYHAGIHVRDYLVSEKYDGVRAIWDGRTLRFRSGNRVPAPDWFLTALPPDALDGELWLGRGRFDELSAMVRRSVPVDQEWRRISYMIFELPAAPGSFRERAERIRQLVAQHQANAPWLVAVEQTPVRDEAALLQRFRAGIAAGAEGLMLHRADAPYVSGRSDVLLKLKPAPDAEAVVIGHEPGRGKYAGQTGALTMQMPDGPTFSLGSGLPDTLRRNPPPLGTVITYRYQETGKHGLPRFPRFLRVREEF